MTEQKEILERISNLAFDIQHTDTLQVAFDKAQAIQNLVEGQQPFMVGEYYKKDSSFGHIYKVIEDSMTEMQSVKFYDCAAGTFKEFTLHEKAIAHDPDATSDEIALFKRAEHFHSKGRKLNEFKINDVVSDQQGRFKVVDRSNGKYIYDIHGVIIEEIAYCTLIMTAEELEAAAKEVEG